MKTKLILLLCLCCLPILIFCQSRKKRKKKKEAPMVYFSAGMNYDNLDATHVFISEQNTRTYTTTTEYKSRASLTASFRKIKPNKRFFELMLTRLHFSNYEDLAKFTEPTGMQNIQVVTTDGQKNRYFETGVRAEYGFFFDHPQFSKITFGISGALSPSYFYFQTLPATSASFPLSHNFISIRAMAIPQMNVKVNKNWSLIFKLSPTLFSQEFTFAKLENPRLTLRQQRTSQSSFNFLDNFVNFQLMLGYNIGSH